MGRADLRLQVFILPFTSQALLKFHDHLLNLYLQTCRFFSIDERLACYCGFPRCRGVVNDTEAEERQANIYASRCELKEWTET